MTITFENGRSVRALLISRTNSIVRVAVAGEEKHRLFRRAGGVWISEDWEVVAIKAVSARQPRFGALTGGSVS